MIESASLVANDSTYGHDVRRTNGSDGATVTTVRLSLLRAPLYPDPESDQGEHTMRVSIMPGAGIPDPVEEGYRLNLPLRTVTDAAATSIEPLIRVSGAVVECVKLAEDRSGDVVVRLYEANGSRSTVRVVASFDAEATETDLLERALPSSRAQLQPAGDREWSMQLRPFQLVTLRHAIIA